MYLHVVVFSLPLSRDTLGPPLHVVGKPKKDNYTDVCGRGFKHEQVKKGFKLSVKFTLLVSALKKKIFSVVQVFWNQNWHEIHGQVLKLAQWLANWKTWRQTTKIPVTGSEKCKESECMAGVKQSMNIINLVRKHNIAWKAVQSNLNMLNNVWFQKISIPPPRKGFTVWPPLPSGFSKIDPHWNVLSSPP